jgi:hypothetical protein
MSAINWKSVEALFAPLIAAALTVVLTANLSAQQTTVRTRLMPDGCDYANNGTGWVRVGCALADGQHLLYRNDAEGGLMYILTAGPNGPFWHPLSGLVTQNQETAQKQENDAGQVSDSAVLYNAYKSKDPATIEGVKKAIALLHEGRASGLSQRANPHTTVVGRAINGLTGGRGDHLSR